MQLLEKFKSYFDKHKIKYKWNKEKDVIIASFDIDSKLGSIKEYIFTRSDSYTVLAQCELHANSESRTRVAEYLMRANYGLILGNFEMDFEDGEIQYKVTLKTDSDRLTDEDIQESLFAPLAMFSRYGDGIVKVIFEVCTPEEAIEIAETDVEHGNGENT